MTVAEQITDEQITDRLEASEKAVPPLPVPRCTFADHSYPAFTASQMYEYAQTVNAALLTELQHRREAEAGTPEGWVLVPKAALDWLNGEAPDPAGMEFGEFTDDYPKPAGAFWWRKVFRQICEFYAAQRPLAASPSSPASGVRVKALEWAELTSPREDGPAEPTGDWEAASIVGSYFVQFFEDHYEALDIDGEYIEGWLGDLEDAKAACQSAYEARILSALGEYP